MRHARNLGKTALAALLCLSLVLGSMAPTVTHTPKVFDTIYDHLEMIAEHGHSHGFEEDFLWALHGHSHDAADHDHSQALLLIAGGTEFSLDDGDPWLTGRFMHPPGRIFRIERPPRA